MTLPLDGPLTLEMAQRRALADKPSLQAVAERVYQAEARIKQARSRYLPTVTVGYSGTHIELSDKAVAGATSAAEGALLGSVLQTIPSLSTGNPLQGFFAGSSLVNALGTLSNIPDTTHQYSGSVTANYTLFDGFNRFYTLQTAKYGYKEIEAVYQEAQRLLLDAVARTWYGVQLARENLTIAKADEAFNQRLLKDAEARFEAGAGSKSDVLNFEVRVRAAQAQLLQGEQDYQIARIALATLMGIPDGQLPDAVTLPHLDKADAQDLHAPVLDDKVAYATEHRPEVSQAAMAVARTKAGQRARRSAFMPQVNAFATYGAEDDDSHFQEEDYSTTVGFNVSYTLFAGGRNKAALTEAKHAWQEAQRNLEEAELAVTGEVRQAVVGLVTAQHQLTLQRETADYVEKNRTLVEKEYRAGAGSLTRLNQAQRDLIEAQGRLAQARVALEQAWHDLDVATAEVLERF